MSRRVPPLSSDRRPSRKSEALAVAPDFVLEQHLFFWFTQVLDRRDASLPRRSRPTNLRAPEWRTLATLHSRHRLSMSALADLTSIDRTTLSRVVERMVKAGWAMRLTDLSDARVTRLALTAAGERLFARIWQPAVWGGQRTGDRRTCLNRLSTWRVGRSRRCAGTSTRANLVRTVPRGGVRRCIVWCEPEDGGSGGPDGSRYRLDVGRVVEPDRVHRGVYSDPAIFELEMERIFNKVWTHVGHESQVPKVGDYWTVQIGRQPMIMVRHSDRSVRVLYNRCPHRGAMLYGDRCGNVGKGIICSYHALAVRHGRTGSARRSCSTRATRARA